MHIIVEIGDVIVFKSGRPDPIIHRVVKIWNVDDEYFFQTKGDRNYGSISSPSLNEMQISEEQLVGRALFRIPYLGWIKIGFVRMIGFFVR